MWPFKELAPVQREPKRKPPVAIGERFKYLGVDMVCSRHYVHHGFDVGGFDAVVAEYVSGRGEIKQCVFHPVDWDALEAELARL